MRKLHFNGQASTKSKGVVYSVGRVYGIRSTNTSRLENYSKKERAGCFTTDDMMQFVRSIIPRLLAGLTTFPTRGDVVWTAAIGAVHVTVMFGFGVWSRFMKPRYANLPPGTLIAMGVVTLVTPSTLEEVMFRGILLPHPAVDGPVTWTVKLGVTALVSNLLFLVYHFSPWHQPKKVTRTVSCTSPSQRYVRMRVLGVQRSSIYGNDLLLWNDLHGCLPAKWMSLDAHCHTLRHGSVLAVVFWWIRSTDQAIVQKTMTWMFHFTSLTVC